MTTSLLNSLCIRDRDMKHMTVEMLAIFPDSDAPIQSINFDEKGKPWLVLRSEERSLHRRKAPKSYFESLGLVDDTDDIGRSIEPSA